MTDDIDEWKQVELEARDLRKEMIPKYQRMRPGACKWLISKMIDLMFWVERVAKFRGH